jgi:uncharacterized membrane protein HdeD (DUF308 family)
MTAPPLENMVLLFVGVFIIYKIYENMMINVWNVQCYMLFIGVLNCVSHIKERIQIECIS